MRNANHWSNRVYKAMLIGQSIELMARGTLERPDKWTTKQKEDK